MDYLRLLRVSARTVSTNSRLWFLGLFLFGGFSFIFFTFHSLDFGRQYWMHALNVLLARPFVAWPAFVGGLAAVLIVINWAKVWFILLAAEVFNLKVLRRQVITDFAAKNLNRGKARAEGRRPPAAPGIKAAFLRLPTVLAISLITTLGMAASSLALFLPTLLFEPDFGARRALATLGAVIFLLLSFVLFCLNVFGSFAAVLYQMSLSGAFNLAAALLKQHWQVILGLVVLLVLGFVFSAALVLFLGLLVQWAVWGFLSAAASLGFFQVSVMMFLVWAVFGSGFWLVLGFLNAVLNLAMLLLFDELVHPKTLPKAAVLENFSASI